VGRICRGLGRSAGFKPRPKVKPEKRNLPQKDLIILWWMFVSKEWATAASRCGTRRADELSPSPPFPIEAGGKPSVVGFSKMGREAMLRPQTSWTRAAGATSDGTDIRFTRKKTPVTVRHPARPQQKNSFHTFSSLSLNQAQDHYPRSKRRAASWFS